MSFDNVQYHEPKQVTANGINIHFDSFGDENDPVILLIMGLGTQMIYWPTEFCQRLASHHFRVIRFDNRDIGKSTWMNKYPVPSTWKFIGNSLFRKKLNAPYLLDDMAVDTLGLLDALSIDKVHLVGASMGGMIAQCIALKSPERINTLSSIMSTTGDRSLPKPKTKISATLLKPVPSELEQYVVHSMKVWKLLHGDHYPFDAQRVEHVIRESRKRGFNPAGVARQLAAIIDSDDRTDALKHLQIPTAVMHGDSDYLVPVECGIATANAIPNAKLTIFKGMGHTLPVQLWSEIVNEIVSLT